METLQGLTWSLRAAQRGGFPQDQRGKLAYIVVSDAHMRLWAARGHRHRGAPSEMGTFQACPMPSSPDGAGILYWALSS